MGLLMYEHSKSAKASDSAGVDVSSGPEPISAEASEAGSPPDDSAVVELVRPHMDLEFYMQQLGQHELQEDDPVRHYVREGWSRGLDPTPEFSTAFYLDRSPDVRRAGLNPFYHYL